MEIVFICNGKDMNVSYLNQGCRHIYSCIFPIAVAFIIFLCSSCSYYTEGGGPYTRSQMKEMTYNGAWQDFCCYVIPRLCTYYELHPERFKSTGRGSELTVQGFTSFVASDWFFRPAIYTPQWGSFHIHGSQISDPRGQSVTFVEDVGHDLYMEGHGCRVKVLHLAHP